MDQQQSNVKRFLKLGYLYEDIMRVLENLRQDAPTNDILEELIRTCRSTSPAQSSPQLIPRGCSRTTPGTAMDPTTEFRPIVIDGSNVAMSHGNKQVFSCRGVQLAVSWFWNRGHRDITVFVPLWRKEQARSEAPITDQHILHELEHRKILVFTPSRCVNGKRVVCYDDRYIVKLAFDSDGIIVSNDNYRDLQGEKPEWKRFIEERLLMYTFANDKFMPPDDPLGRNGPTIDNFLRKGARVPETRGQHCPYGKKCTYGVKCRFYHPERSSQAQLSVADMLRAKKRELPPHQASPLEGPASLQYSSFPPATAPTPQQRSGRFSPSPTPLRCAFTSSSLESQYGTTSTQHIEAFSYGAPETDFRHHPCHGRCDQAGHSPHMPGHQQRHRQGSRSSHSREPVHYAEQPFPRQPSAPAADLNMRAWGYSPPGTEDGSPSFYRHNLDTSDLALLINEFRII